jgi:phage I-like protein
MLRQMKTTLVALNTAISNGALATDKLPDRIKLLGWGDSATAKGPVRLTSMSAKAIQAQAKLGYGEIALDFEHNTVPGSIEYGRTQEPRTVAAYGKPDVVENDGLYLSSIRWTPEGEKAARNYADLSPAVQLDKDGQVIFVHSAALTRNGAVDNLHFFSASGRTAEEHKPMNIETSDIAPLLGLNADADKSTVLAKLKERLTPMEPKAVTAFSVEIDGKTHKFGASEILALNAKVIELGAKVDAKEKLSQDVERDQVIAMFSAEGKVPLGEDGKPAPVETLKTFSVPELKRLLANTPKTVTLSAGRKPTAAAAAGGADLKGLARSAAALNAQLANV